MIRFTLRQVRPSGILVLGALVTLAVVLLVTGPHLVHLYDTVVANCASKGDCGNVTSGFLSSDHQLQAALNIVAIVVPCLIGLFWGAPLVANELESGTYRLAWTQGVTRLHWMALKLGILGAASMATAGLFSWMTSWWSSPIDRVNAINGSVFALFGQRDIAPVGYAAFAFMLGVFAGIVIRRTLPAMVSTLVAFVAIRIAIQQWVHPHLISPITLVSAINPDSIGFGSINGGPVTVQAGGPNIANAWIYSSQFVDKAGQIASPAAVTSLCPNLGFAQPPKAISGPGIQAAPSIGKIQSVLQSCATKLRDSYHLVTTYQPAGHYWPMQWLELGLYLVLALGLAGLCYWWVRHRIA